MNRAAKRVQLFDANSDYIAVENLLLKAKMATGIRVLDCGMLYAGPLIATMLADHGADGIKVEPPGGDAYRSWGPMWALVGRNKRSLTLDLTAAQGRDLFMRLVAEVDVVVT